MLSFLLFAALLTDPEVETAAPEAPALEAGHDALTPPAGTARTIRPGEDEVVRDGDAYRAGPSFTEAALPEGYPAPTAPGAVEIKRYPPVRRAQVSGSGPEASSFRGFWPLFRHIQRHDIAMTAPVEMIYDGVTPADAPSGHTVEEGADWTMSFLYRSADNGPTGPDGTVQVIDAEPVTVIAVGVRGPLYGPTIREHAGELMAWIEDSDQWEVAGDLRTFGYNGPSVRSAVKWWEVQIPIRPRATAADAG